MNSNKKVIYIGKAKDLRKRIKSYFSGSKPQSRKLKRLKFESFFLEITITNSELEALLLEQHLIKEIKPKYNVQFKDDKGYPWIKISTSKEYPAAISFVIIKLLANCFMITALTTKLNAYKANFDNVESQILT